MVDVVLINAPMILYETEEEKDFYSTHGGDEVSHYPLNLLYIASNLIKHGHSVKVIDVLAQGKILPEVVEEVKNLQPKVIGISAMTTSIQSAYILCKTLKGIAPIGIGGVHIAVDPEFIDRYPVFDFCVVGEGEITFEKIVSDIKNNKSIKKKYIGEAVKNLDDLPFPARHLIDTKIYRREEMSDYEIPSAGIFTSRGCPYNCLFCSIPGLKQKVRFRTAKNVADEMESIYKQCAGNYCFNDDCFTLNKKRVIELCKEIVKRGLKTKWIVATRADRVDDEMVGWMKKGGCTELYFGVESGSKRIRNKVIGKNLKEETIKHAISLCKKHNILSNIYLMMGFPTETKEDLKETVKIGQRVKADVIGIHITRPFPGSDIFKQAISEGIIKETMIDDFIQCKNGKGIRNNYPLYIPKGLTYDDIIAAKKSAYRRFYLHPMTILRRIRIWLKIPGRFKEDLKLFKIAPHVLLTGGTKGQLS